MMHRAAIAAAALAVAGALWPAAVEAQITFDGRPPFTNAPAPTGPNFVISDGAGRQIGNNLFHSFGQFNVGAGESATFTGPNSTANVIGRVTGGASSINGLIDTRTWMPSANFFLLNPAGVMLGPSASLNVGGAFHVSTADYVCLGSAGCLNDPASGKFFANPNAPSVLTVAPPAAFGFLGPPTGSIVVQGGGIPLSVDSGQTMSFVGGPIQVSGAFLSAPGGRVQLVSVSSAGEIALPGFEVVRLPSVPVPTLGSITVSTGTTIDVSGDPGGTVSIRGGQLVIDNSAISAVTGDADSASVAIDLAAAASLTITNNSQLLSITGGAGRGGDIQLTGGSVKITTSIVGSANGGAGRGGDIRVTGGSVELANGSLIVSNRGADGAGGDIAITSDTVRLSGVSGVTSSNGLEGPVQNGKITVTATGAMVITEGSALVSSADAGDAALVTVSAGSLSMDQAATIQSSAPSGRGGDVTVTAGSLSMDQAATIQSSTFLGRGGDVVVTAPQLTLQGGAAISTSMLGPGRGGDVHVTSSGIAVISGEFTGLNTTSFFGDASTPPDQGVPGDIVARFGSLFLTDKATIQSGVLFGTKGGNVDVGATGAIVISNLAGIASQAQLADAGNVTVSAPQISIDHGFISTATLATGRAGNVFISGGTLELVNGGQIVTASLVPATGAGGDVNVNLGTLTISGSSTGGSSLPPIYSTSFTDPRSGIFSTAQSEAPGGNITIHAPNIRLGEGSTISAASTGTENAIAGNITINFGDKLSLETGASITTDSLLADGGNIVITSSGSILFVSDSQITTSVRNGVGGGGNITLGTVEHPIEFVVLANGGIHADAFGGPGGNINIFANVLLSSTPILTAITASSTLSTSGTISINAVATDVTSSLPELRTDTREAAALLRASCAARLAEGKTSSLVVAGREGVPLEPGGLMPSALMEPRRVAELGSVVSFLTSEWPGLRLAYLDAACGR